MAKGSGLGKELKELGAEIATALKQMKASSEFKQLEKDLASGIKSISGSVAKALKAAGKSSQTAKLKNRMGRVMKAGATEGKTQAKRAEVIAAQKIKQASAAIKDLSKKIKKRRDVSE